MKVLVVDIGGTHIKFRTQLQAEPVKVKSGSKMTPEQMMCEINTKTTSWTYDRVSLGYPGLFIHNVPLTEPRNLGKGWRQFDYKKASSEKSIRMVNDAAMQALGSYRGHRMLFLGLGTGLGSAMVVDGVVQDMALSHLGWKKGDTYEDVLGTDALTRRGRKAWLKNLEKVIRSLETNLKPDYVTIGGGNAKLVNGLSNRVRIGTNKHRSMHLEFNLASNSRVTYYSVQFGFPSEHSKLRT